jgi:PEP-CTERM motif-containing protein
MKNKTLISGAGFGVATALFLSMGSAQAAPITIAGTNGLEIELQGEACIAATCTDLATAGYNVTGGAVLNATQSGSAKKPGEDTLNDGAVSSFNVTSSSNTPSGAIDTIEVTGLDSVFSFYWGSIDSYNVVEFFLGNTSMATFDGTDLASLLGTSSSPNFDTDQYVTFSVGAFRPTRPATTFDRVELSSTGGVAFEVAAASVPEPGTLALLSLGLLGMGISAKRRNKA